MKGTILDKILDAKRERLAVLKSSAGAADIRKRALMTRSAAEPHALRRSLEKRSRINIIAEIKRASPSKGIIDADVNPAEKAREYAAGGACGLSVLTEEDFFSGSLDDLRAARAATSLPILRKDFVVDEFQIYEAAEAGADAVLLIVAALPAESLEHLHDVAENELGLDALVEVHDRSDLETARGLGCRLIGVNNRSLHTFDVSLDVSRELIKFRPDKALMIAESGISSADDIDELSALGFDGFLVGESLMRNADPQKLLEEWV